LDPALVTEALLTSEARLGHKPSADTEDTIIKAPLDFTDAMKWKTWNELFWNYLGSLYNQYRVLLTYVIWDLEAAITDAAVIASYQTKHKEIPTHDTIGGQNVRMR
jgi:hypothetical protein